MIQRLGYTVMGVKEVEQFSALTSRRPQEKKPSIGLKQRGIEVVDEYLRGFGKSEGSSTRSLMV